MVEDSPKSRPPKRPAVRESGGWSVVVWFLAGIGGLWAAAAVDWSKVARGTLHAFRAIRLDEGPLAELPKSALPYRLYLSPANDAPRPWQPFSSGVPGLETRLRAALDEVSVSLSTCLRTRKERITEPIVLDVSLLTYAIRLRVLGTQLNVPEHAKAEIDCLIRKIESTESRELAVLSGEIKETYHFRAVLVAVAPGVSEP